MKLKTLLVMAVAAIGALALSVPAFAASSSNGGIPSIDSQLGQLKAAGKAAKSRANSSSKHNTRVNTDLKRLGENVAALRKGQDQTNFTLGAVTAQAVSALSSLQAGLVTVAAATTNFKYGVVQVGIGTGGAGDGIAGLGPSMFYVTPPIQPTGAQSTVSFALPPTTFTGGVPTRLFTAVRSLDPTSGAVECRVTIMGAPPAVLGATGIRSTQGNGSGGFFKKMPQSRLTPQNGNPNFPLALITTEDNVFDLGTELNGNSLFTAGDNPVPATLSCLRTS